MRSTVVDALYSQDGFWYIAVSPSSTTLTYVISVDVITGNPLYTGVPFIDVFTDHSIALKALSDIGAQRKIHGEGLIGLAATENATTIAIIDKTEVTAVFPPNHKIRTIRHVSYIHIPIARNAPKNSVFEDFQTVDNHYICDTYDLTRLFPVSGIDNPDLGFVWNCGWRKPFEILGIPQVCVYLVQGVCISKKFDKFGFTLAHVVRRSVLNPGTRYAARGLNEKNSPGNEVECELLFFKDNKFWSERWRRGSIPIRWKTTLSSKLGSPKHRVDKEQYFNGTVEYFKNLTDRFGEIPIRCISLLQTEEDHSENEIKGYFKTALEKLFDEGVTNVLFTPFDLNKHLHADGSGEAMMDFLSYIGPLGECDGFTEGILPNTIEQQQQGLMRFNCADSLDRTNLATFYYAMKFTAEWCKMMKVGLSNTPNADPNQPNLIIDQTIIDFLAEVFVCSGNVVSRLYTNTPAIKVNAIKKFSPSIVVTQSDTNITLQRRMQNVVNDPVRQKLIELWTNPPELTWFHRLGSNHLFIVPHTDDTQFPRAIFQPSKDQIEISSKESLICLPTPMVIFSFMILMFPANQKLNGITVIGGMDLKHMEPILHLTLPMVEQSTWLRFRPSNSVRWGLESIPAKYIRFLQFKFDTEDNKFSIGYMRIEGRSIYCRVPTMITHQVREYDDANKENFIEKFEDFIHSSMNLDEVLNLEKIRITLSVHEAIRNQLALERCISPWLLDPRSQLIAAPTPKAGFCAFCKQPIENNAPKYYYCMAKKLPSLIMQYKPQQSDKDLKDCFCVCSNCNEKAEILAGITLAYEEEYYPEELPLPHFEMTPPSLELMEKNQVLTNEATSAYINEESSLLWATGGHQKLEKDEEKELELFIVQQAIVLRFVVETKCDNIAIFDENKNQLEMKRLNEDEVEYRFKEQPITQRLKFYLKAVDDEAVLTRIRAHFIRTEFPLEEVKVHEPEKLIARQTVSPPIIDWNYDSVSRTETFKLIKVLKIVEMQVEVVVSRGASSPLSFYLAFYKKDQFIESTHVILPEASHGSKLWYNIGGEKGTKADKICVFYCDRTPNLKPHNIKFVVK